MRDRRKTGRTPRCVPQVLSAGLAVLLTAALAVPGGVAAAWATGEGAGPLPELPVSDVLLPQVAEVAGAGAEASAAGAAGAEVGAPGAGDAQTAPDAPAGAAGTSGAGADRAPEASDAQNGAAGAEAGAGAPEGGAGSEAAPEVGAAPEGPEAQTASGQQGPAAPSPETQTGDVQVAGGDTPEAEAVPAASGVPVDKATFPDDEFRSNVSWYFDKDKDGFLSDDERLSVTRIDVTLEGIASLKGIEVFSNLQYLDCAFNSLTSLDVAGLSNLETLYCHNNSLTSLDVAGLSNLETLYCSKNSLSSLELAGLSNLKFLSCYRNSLSSLELAGLSNLKYLSCSDNSLVSLDVRGCENLEELRFGGNNLKELDLRQNKRLKVAYHAVNGERVYISAGMTEYIGCDFDWSHTGNIIIDLEGSCTTRPDGSRTVDLYKVISPVLIDQITEDSDLYDPKYKILTIPAGKDEVDIAASDGNRYYFSADPVPAPEPVAHTVAFVSQGATVATASVGDGEAVARPDDPQREGFAFLGWFSDEACTQPYNFANPVKGDLVLYAGWEAVPAPDPEPDPDPAPEPDPDPDPDPDPAPKPSSQPAAAPALAKTGDSVPFAAAVVAASLGLAALVVAVRKKAR